MAAPTLQAEGATATGVTTGAPSVTIPTHQADDIIIVAAIFWGPNTAGDAAQIPTPANYTLLGTQVGQPAGTRDGWTALFWRRVTGAGTTVTLTRGASWDTGTDTCFNARAYVIRGCIATGNPFEFSANSGPHTAANQAFAAQTVSGSERLVVQFGNSMDNAAFAMTSTGWTTGTEDDDAGGTDSAFQTARKDNVSSSTAADTSTVAAPAQGAYAFHGVVFLPVAATPTRGRVSFTELEVPFVPTRGLVSFAELEIPTVPTRGRVSWAELEVPGVATRGRVSWTEFEVPDIATPTRGRVSWAELEVPAVGTRGRVSWVEFEVPDLGSGGGGGTGAGAVSMRQPTQLTPLPLSVP
jgi:hypothetical protein